MNTPSLSTLSAEQLQEKIRQEAKAVDQAMRQDLGLALAGCDPLLSQVLDHALFSGGKRIRPLLTVFAARLAGRDDAAVLELAIALEYLHAATLIHDDIIDGAELRRGRPALHQAFSLAAALLAGDWLHARAMRLMGGHGGPQCLDILCAATHAMVDGEFLQLRYVGRVHEGGQDTYLRVVRSKTAMLIGAACEIGAVWAGGNQQVCAALRRYGRNIGTAFQLVDDLLDYCGDPRAMGKAGGSDLAEGKCTLPLLHALQQADEATRRRLEAAMAAPDSADALNTVRDILTRLGSFDYARAQAERLVQEGIAALDILACPTNRSTLEVLAVLGAFVLKRSH